MFCPRCGNSTVRHFENNRPVADFYCEDCGNQYELKSKNGGFEKRITDGAYDSMIKRITSNQNPDLFCLSYSAKTHCVANLILIPKHFFVPEIIEKRKPLAPTARRAGWVGCNIMVGDVPTQGKIEIIQNGKLVDKGEIVTKTAQSDLLLVQDIAARGWLLDVLYCLNQVQKVEFSLQDIYMSEDYLRQKHPKNNHVKAKIRQQLQVLRDKGFVAFLGNGRYRKLDGEQL